jgi:hypothetical protein
MTLLRIGWIWLILATPAYSQFFEGKIVYENKYTSKQSGFSDNQWVYMMGSSQEYFIKGGNYKSLSNGALIAWQLYINADNKLYHKSPNNELILWNDGAVNPDKVIQSELKKNVIQIAGYACDELILTCKSGVQKYYFSPQLKVKAARYKKHKYGNWSEYIARAKALPLKIIIENSQFTLVSVAVEVQAMKLEDQLFQLPSGSKTERSPY